MDPMRGEFVMRVERVWVTSDSVFISRDSLGSS